MNESLAVILNVYNVARCRNAVEVTLKIFIPDTQTVF